MNELWVYYAVMWLLPCDRFFIGGLCGVALSEAHLLTYDDKIYISTYWISKLRKLTDYFDGFVDEYISCRDDINFEYNSEIGQKAINKETIESEAKEMEVFYMIQNDEEYQNNLNKLFQLISEDNFIQNKSIRFKKIISELETIKSKYEVEMYGTNLKPIEEPQYHYAHPRVVLLKTIAEYDDYIKEQSEMKESEAAKSPKDIARKKAAAIEAAKKTNHPDSIFDAPQISSRTDESILNEYGYKIKIKCKVRFPCCPREEVSILENCKGTAIIICPNCHQKKAY